LLDRAAKGDAAAAIEFRKVWAARGRARERFSESGRAAAWRMIRAVE
jgi:hypothetical protein